MACAEFGHFQQLRSRLAELGASAEDAMRPFVAPLDAFHASTAPADWLEGLVKAYVGDGIAADFYREISVLLDDDTRELVLEVFGDTGHSAFVVSKVRSAIEADPRVAGRLALWGRRLMGEALSQAQRVAAERDALAVLLAGGGGGGGMDLVELGRMFTRITEQHTKRMATLGSGGLTAQVDRVLHGAEADAAGLLLTDLDVGQLVGGHQHPATAAVGEVEQRCRVGGARPHQGRDVVRRQVGLDDQLPGDALHPDLDLHADLRLETLLRTSGTRPRRQASRRAPRRREGTLRCHATPATPPALRRLRAAASRPA